MFRFGDLVEILYIKSSRNTFEHFRDNWYSEGRILPDGVNNIKKKFHPISITFGTNDIKKFCWARRVTLSGFIPRVLRYVPRWSKLVPMATWRLRFVHPWSKWIYVYECTVRPRDTAEVRNAMLQCVSVLRHAALLRYDTIRFDTTGRGNMPCAMAGRSSG